MSKLDKRLNAWRNDIANIALKGQINTQKFVESHLQQIIVPVLSLRQGPGVNYPQDSQLLLGDFVKVFDIENNWAWVQNCRDNYVGYCPIDGLGDLSLPPTHQVSVLRTILFLEPDLKTAAIDYLTMTSAVCIVDTDGKFSRLDSGGWIFSNHLATIDDKADDFLATAHQFLNVPYLWGGNSSLGIDCSGLVQIALRRAGYNVLRDTDMQENSIGKNIPFDGDKSNVRAGDLVFWKGHVGFYCDDDMLLHANATDMMVSKTPFEDICRYILKQENTPVTSIRRL